MVRANAEGTALLPEGQKAMGLAIGAISKAIKDQLAKANMDAEDLWLILHGGRGAYLVGEKMFEMVKVSMLN